MNTVISIVTYFTLFNGYRLSKYNFTENQHDIENDSRQTSQVLYGMSTAATSIAENSDVISGRTEDKELTTNANFEEHIYESFDAESGSEGSSDGSYADAYDFVYDCNDTENKSDSFENIYEEINFDSSTEGTTYLCNRTIK